MGKGRGGGRTPPWRRRRQAHLVCALPADGAGKAAMGGSGRPLASTRCSCRLTARPGPLGRPHVSPGRSGSRLRGETGSPARSNQPATSSWMPNTLAGRGSTHGDGAPGLLQVATFPPRAEHTGVADHREGASGSACPGCGGREGRWRQARAASRRRSCRLGGVLEGVSCLSAVVVAVGGHQPDPRALTPHTHGAPRRGRFPSTIGAGPLRCRRRPGRARSRRSDRGRGGPA